MVNGVGDWTISSVLVSVRDLDHSSVFYQDVMNIREVFREDQIAILGGIAVGPFTLLLREAHRGSLRTGQQALGIRSLVCDVGSGAELDRVEERLRALDALRNRQFFDEAERFEFVSGYDPDRLPLMFTANEPGKAPALEDYHHGLAGMYAVDV
jgi:catechol 2,3-dioxygenase-like lactoylglutathione lyase family enzyme